MYTAPELRLGLREFQNHPGVDVYSLGRLGMFILSGVDDRLDQIENTELRSILDKAISENILDRYRDAAELHAALCSTLGHSASVSNESIQTWASKGYVLYKSKQLSANSSRLNILQGTVESVNDQAVRIRSENNFYRVPQEEVSWTRPYHNARRLLAPGQEISFLRNRRFGRLYLGKR